MSDRVQRIYLAADVAEAMHANGLTIRTSAAVRQAVLDGRLEPDLQSPRGVHAWTQEALNRDLLRVHQLAALRARLGPPRRRPEPQQQELFRVSLEEAHRQLGALPRLAEDRLLHGDASFRCLPYL